MRTASLVPDTARAQLRAKQVLEELDESLGRITQLKRTLPIGHHCSSCDIGDIERTRLEMSLLATDVRERAHITTAIPSSRGNRGVHQIA